MVYIAGDTLRHQPMGAGHMTVLQLCGPMAFRVLQWCHPMLASTTRTSCCTRMITLYGARKWIQARAVTCTLRFTSGVTPANLFTASMVAELSLPHTHKALVGLETRSYHAAARSVRSGRRSTN